MKQQIIPGFNGKYEITEDGKVFSKYSNKYLNQINNGNGYYNVKLQKDIQETNGKREKSSKPLLLCRRRRRFVGRRHIER